MSPERTGRLFHGSSGKAVRNWKSLTASTPVCAALCPRAPPRPAGAHG